MRTCRALPVLFLLAACAAPPSAPVKRTEREPDPRWVRARPGYAWEFPRDHAAHRAYAIEWWYLTGILQAEDAPGRTFGYQLTVFRIGLRPERTALASAWATDTLLLGHAAVTDVAGNDHRFADVLHREIPLLARFGAPGDPVLAWCRAPAGTDGEWSIRWNGAGFDAAAVDARTRLAFRLRTTAEKPLVLHGERGFSAKSGDAGSASLYYSYTRLATEGTLTLDGRSFRVRGTSWMDKEFSTSSLAPQQVGWDWLALRLADGRDLMLYVMRRADGSADTAQASLVSPEGEVRTLPASAWTLRATARWRAYPSRFRLDVPGEGIHVAVVPLVLDQENRGTLPGAPDYWEGAVRVEDEEGSVVGDGYVELTGYGPGNRPPV
ncbi:MAG TPA: lipocalin-like domain-containing protein [Candidatus Polarisedimenticolaceae bacterium]|nr:lipocalin-like domain-containing protein [Candidatus Polarisedimenticolaceae bacterium]